jgi:hypothetical protein
MIESTEARAADRRMSLRIQAASMAGGLATGIVFALLPL